MILHLIKYYIFGFLFTFSLCAPSTEIKFKSSVKQTTLIELYTSEGCSSCPSADKWLNKYMNEKTLFKDVIPMAFHVDYWDYLGWKDSYSKKSWTQRQYTHNREGNISQIYTPGFVINGKEWRGFFKRKSFNLTPKKVGQLEIKLNNKMLKGYFRAIDNKNQLYELHIAILASNLSNNILSGENEGKILEHHFVVLALKSKDSKNRHWQLELPNYITNNDKNLTNKIALIAWVTNENSLIPIQATGGWIK